MSCGERPTIGWIGEKLDLKIKQGARFGPFEFELELEDEATGEIVPFDLTGGTLTGQIRRKGLDSGTPIATLGLTITGENTFDLVLTAAQTAAIPAGELETDRASQYVHDIMFTPPGGEPEPLYYGNAIVARQVTKPSVSP